MSTQLANIKISGVGYADLVAASIIPKDTPAAQVQIFAAICQETGLSATKKEIYLINNRGQFYNIVSIGGFRSLAEKTGLYAGKDEVMYDKQSDGTYKTIADYPKGTFPKSATLTVYKNVCGVRCPFTATIATNEYMSGYMFKSMPFTMINKVVESHALRAAFASLNNFYNEDELPAMQGNTEAAQSKQVIEVKPKEKAILDANHQDWDKVVEFMKKQNGETTESAFERLKKSYTLNETVIETLTKFVPLHD